MSLKRSLILFLKCKNERKFKSKAFYVTYFRVFEQHIFFLVGVDWKVSQNHDSSKEHLLYLVNETLLIDIDRLNNNLEQQKLFCLNHIKRSCISFPYMYNVHQVVSCSLISFSKGSKPQRFVTHGPFKELHRRTAELLQNLLYNHWYTSRRPQRAF